MRQCSTGSCAGKPPGPVEVGVKRRFVVGELATKYETTVV
jgi:hypothetical protein